MKTKDEQKKKDLAILKALYNGTHLDDGEKERAFKLLYLLELELKRRV